MKRLLILVPLLMIGCIQQRVVYSHTDAFDRMTSESRGDNISDYNNLRFKAEEMCASEGFKDGIIVLSASPSNSAYTIDYQCKGKNPGVVEQLTSVYGQVRKQLEK